MIKPTDINKQMQIFKKIRERNLTKICQIYAIYQQKN